MRKKEASYKGFSGKPAVTQLLEDLQRNRKLQKKLFMGMWERHSENQTRKKDIPKKLRDKPQFWANWLKVMNTLIEMGLIESPLPYNRKALSKIEKLYMDWVYLNKSQSGRVRFPSMGATDCLKELLKRGFITPMEYPKDQNYYYIEATYPYRMIYPQRFEQHSEAIKRAMEVGIPGYTQTILPKD